MTARRKKKKRFKRALTVIFLLLFVFLILFVSGALTAVKDSINKMIYPLKHEKTILAACEEYDLDPAFVCAVIYTESKFREDAVSSAGALGLMQLMPETFEYLADKRGEATPEDTTYHETNIDYGTYYIRYLSDTYGFEDIYTTAAAYNAGPARVIRWLEDEKYSADGETLHTIPYSETENYIEKIKKAEDMYASLYFEE